MKLKVIVDDLSNNIRIEIRNLDIKYIDVGHTLSIKYLENNNIKKIEGFVQSIKHEIGLDNNQTMHIQINT